MNQLTKIALAWELYEQSVSKTHIAEMLEINRETIGIWIKSVITNPDGLNGLNGFIDSYLMAKK